MLQLRCLQRVYSREDIGIPVDRVNTIALAGGDEREMNGNSLSAHVGTREQRIFPHQNPSFNGSFALIVINGDVWIFQKSGESYPMIQSVIDCLQQVMCRMKGGLSFNNGFAEQLNEGFGFSATNGQSGGCRFVLNFALNPVECSVDIEHRIANGWFCEFRLEVTTPRVSAATGLSSAPISEQCIEATCSIYLDGAAIWLKEFKIAIERQVWRIVEDCRFGRSVTNVGRNLALADVVFVFSVLNLYGCVVRFDDRRLEEFIYVQLVQKGEGRSCCLHPIALCRARNHDILAGKDFLLTIVGKPIVEHANDDFCQKAWTGVTTRNWRTRFFCRDNILFALWASSCFLTVIKNFETSANHLQLMSEKVADKLRLYIAVWTSGVFGFHGMFERFVRQLLSVLQNMLNACEAWGVGTTSRLWLGGGLSIRVSWARIVLFRLLPVFSLVAFLRLHNQYVKLFLHFLEKFAQLFVALNRLFQLVLQILDEGGQALNFSPSIGVLGLQFHKSIFAHEGTAGSGIYSMISLPPDRAPRSDTTYVPPHMLSVLGHLPG